MLNETLRFTERERERPRQEGFERFERMKKVLLSEKAFSAQLRERLISEICLRGLVPF